MPSKHAITYSRDIQDILSPHLQHIRAIVMSIATAALVSVSCDDPLQRESLQGRPTRVWHYLVENSVADPHDPSRRQMTLPMYQQYELEVSPDKRTLILHDPSGRVVMVGVLSSQPLPMTLVNLLEGVLSIQSLIRSSHSTPYDN